MYIERSTENRDGKRIGEPHRERMPSGDRDSARKAIELEAMQFPHHGYTAEHDYWWARHDADEYQVTRWFIMSGDFE